jgi:protein-S-isoprenylcysteine O-methyltransferase Ste14
MTENTDHPQLILPPPVMFLGYLVGALILQWAVPFNTPWGLLLRILGGLLVIAGFALAGYAVSAMRQAHTTPDPRETPAALVTAGPYRYSRNPIYIGFLLIYLGFTLLAGTLWGLLLSPFLIGTVTQWIIHAEESNLSKKFKDEYESYISHVRRWI